jgi:hypothetical protein
MVLVLSFPEMGPSAIDMEIGLLGPDTGGSLDLCAAFLKFSLNILMSCQDFELINAYLGVFLAKNGETLIKESRLVEVAQEVREKDKCVERCTASTSSVFMCCQILKKRHSMILFENILDFLFCLQIVVNVCFSR